MKRNPETVYCRPTHHVPWWRRCMACRLDFRWERGWAGPRAPQYTRGGYERTGQRYHLCSECAPTEEKAREIFDQIGKPPKLERSPAPPLAPKRSPWSIEFDSDGQATGVREQTSPDEWVVYPLEVRPDGLFMKRTDVREIASRRSG